MDVTNEQIKEEFKRQVRLCSGVGEKEMLMIVHEHFHPAQKEPCKHPIAYRVFYPNLYSNKCMLCGSMVD